MKKIITILLGMSLILSISGCQKMTKRTDLNNDKLVELSVKNMMVDFENWHEAYSIYDKLLAEENLSETEILNRFATATVDYLESIYAMCIVRLSNDYENYEMYPDFYRVYLETLAYYADTYKETANKVTVNNILNSNDEDLILLLSLSDEICDQYLYLLKIYDIETYNTLKDLINEEIGEIIIE